MKLSTILDFVDDGQVALPEFQRGYVWNREQVRGLFSSLYRGYPIGGFMMWSTKADMASIRGDAVKEDSVIKMLLDGQQRVTSLYGVMRGRPPAFFEGNAQAFTGLYFNVQSETFEFFAKAKMSTDPSWQDVSALFAHGLKGKFGLMQKLAATEDDAELYMERLNAVTTIAERQVNIDEVSGADKTLDVVVEIFNRVNSGGTKLSKGDLALAKICASWPEARQELNAVLAKYRAQGFKFSLDLLLRVVNGIVTGKAPFAALAGVPVAEVQEGIRTADKYIGSWLDIISGRLGLDHDRVLFGRYALVVLARHLSNHKGAVPSAQEQGKLLYWFALVGMFGRYAGSTETVLSQDLDAVDSGGVDALIRTLERSRGDLTVRDADFTGSTIGSRFYPTLYMLTRARGARDFGTGVPLSASMLGHLSSLDVHHIFPKAQLYARDVERNEVNAVANFCFLTKNTNIKISSTPPESYMPQIEAAHPGALASQWIPDDPQLWSLDRFSDFLAARRELLAVAANDFLSELVSQGINAATQAGTIGTSAATTDVSDSPGELDELISWLLDQGFTEPERDIEVSDPMTGALICTAEAFWPDGLQPGLGDPMVLEMDEGPEVRERLGELSYHAFSTVAGLRTFATGLLADEGPPAEP